VTLLVHPRVKDNFVRFQTVFGDASKLRFVALMINSSGLNQIVVAVVFLMQLQICTLLYNEYFTFMYKYLITYNTIHCFTTTWT